MSVVALISLMCNPFKLLNWSAMVSQLGIVRLNHNHEGVDAESVPCAIIEWSHVVQLYCMTRPTRRVMIPPIYRRDR